MAFNGALAVLLAAKYCKHNPLFAWREEAFPEIGRRADKFCFRVDLLNLLQDRCGEMLITLFPVSLSFLDFRKENMLYKLKALLVTLKHPYILPVVDIHYSREKRGLLVLQPFVAAGSLKDRIYRTAPTHAYRDKYNVATAAASPLPLSEVARYGRHVLEALAALQAKGIVCEHLSTGNIVIDDDGATARIADIFTPLLAIDRFADVRERTVPLEAKVALDVLLFGHVLYEMATGLELASVQPEASVLELLAPEIADVLELIFFPAFISDRDYTEAATPMASSTEDVDDGVDSDNDNDNDQDETASVVTTMSTVTTSAGHVNSRRYVVTLDDLLHCALFATADVAPIATRFAGFRFDSSMKRTIRTSMRINASRNDAYVVHYKEKQALQRARERAERRVYDERDKQEQRIQQLATNTHRPRKDLGFNSKTTLSRRKSYRASAALPHRQLSRTSSSSGTGGDTSSSAHTA